MGTGCVDSMPGCVSRREVASCKSETGDGKTGQGKMPAL
jgi:hypothetical protein